MSPAAGALTPGFAAPVHDAQQVFRAVLDAMARPLAPQPLEVALAPPAPLSPETGAVVLALCDEQTPLWLSETLRPSGEGGGDVEAWIRFHTGAPIVGDAADALFCIAACPAQAPPFERLDSGTDEEPHLSATVIIDVSEASEASAAEGAEARPNTRPPADGLLAAGPGIDGSLRWEGAGVPKSFLRARHAYAEAFPRGIDLLLAGHGAVVGLPRTTVLTPREDI